MSPIPQVTPGVTRRLTKNSPPPRIGVGQKSSDIELTGSGRFSGAPQGASLDSLCATQMSMSVRGSPAERGLVEAMYRLSPSGDWIGQPSCTAEFNSALVPRTLSASTAVAHGENSSACADGAVNSATSASPTTTHVGENILLSFLWEVQVLAPGTPARRRTSSRWLWLWALQVASPPDMSSSWPVMTSPLLRVATAGCGRSRGSLLSTGNCALITRSSPLTRH